MSRADTWRQRVYDAEVAWKSGHLMDTNDEGRRRIRYIDIESAQAILDSLAENFDIEPVKIVVNRRLKQWAGWYMKHGRSDDRSPRIEVKRARFEYKTMLHEFAHHLDAMRVSDHDGKGHGGSFSQAMLDIVELHLGREAMSDLLRSYENHGVPIGAAESRKAVARARDGVKRRQERHGTIEEAWAIKFIHESYGTRWIEQDKMSVTAWLDKAGVWKRKSTVEKIAEQISTDTWTAEIVKVRAELDTLYSNRWWAIEEISGKE